MSYFVIANYLSFEYMMSIAENEFNRNYENYNDFEEEFKINVKEWESIFISNAKEELLEKLTTIVNVDFLSNISIEGKFFEQVDYIFIFCFKVIGIKSILEIIISKMLDDELISGEEFNFGMNEMDIFFSPSYSGAEKNEFWNNMQVPGITWPPVIIEG